jgi:glycyl-tRNA synthetase beta chain
MPELLFEIGVEDLPALSIEPATMFMKSYLEDKFKGLGLTYAQIEVLGTPRRLVVMVDDLMSRQADITEELLGPSVAIAFDKQGELSQAGLGFIKAKGIDKKDIIRKKTDKGEVIAASVMRSGSYTKDLLPPLLVDMMGAIPFKKRMRWCSSAESFARPIRWLLCLYEGVYLPLSYADVQSSNQSRGHRLMAGEPFVVTSKEQYLRELKNRFVILSSEAREAQFIKEAKEQVARLGETAEMIEDPELLATVRNLMEYPYAIVGKFEDKYLQIPREILICEMKAHQKCFAVRDTSGALLPNFLCSAAVKPYDRDVFAQGNARVLRARFEDGAFYFAEDKKKRLREHQIALNSLVFERELGSVADKSERILHTALALAHGFSLSPDDSEIIKLAAPILKADLVTGVVGQFPELQGVMGRIYAKIDGERPEVCEVIEQHYWPRSAEDALPKSKAAAILSIADKLDTIVGVISIGKRPVGNKDPFALRRSAISIVRMLVHFGFSIDLDKLIAIAYGSYQGKLADHKDDIKDFITQRARGILVEDLSKESREYAVSFADSVLLVGSLDLIDVFARAHTLLAMRKESANEFDGLVQAFKRASNIVKKADVASALNMDEASVKLLSLPVEQELVGLVLKTKALLNKDYEKGAGLIALQARFRDVFGHITAIKPKLDAFFDQVMVMVDDQKLKEARLALLSEIKAIADNVADFTHL